MALCIPTHLLPENIVPTHHNFDGLTPWQKFFGSVPDVSMPRAFGEPVYILVLEAERSSKLVPTSSLYHVIGIDLGSKVWWCFNPISHQQVSLFHCLFPADCSAPLDIHLPTFGWDTYNNNNNTKLFIGDDDDDDDDGNGGGENANANDIGEHSDDVGDVEDVEDDECNPEPEPKPI